MLLGFTITSVVIVVLLLVGWRYTKGADEVFAGMCGLSFVILVLMWGLFGVLGSAETKKTKIEPPELKIAKSETFVTFKYKEYTIMSEKYSVVANPETTNVYFVREFNIYGVEMFRKLEIDE